MTPADGSRRFIEGVGSADKTQRIYPGLYHEIFNEPEKTQVIGELGDWLEARLKH
jgi:alpha-beta hydrolase superfamily lysophospholipase